MNALNLPPWGLMHEAYMAEIANKPIPADCKTLDGQPATLVRWQAWLNQVVDDMATSIWPRYDAAAADWRGTAVAAAPALNDADYRLLRQLRPALQLSVTARTPTTETHGKFFEDEDMGSIGVNHAVYDPGLPPALLHALPGVLFAGVERKVGSFDLQLKHALQRPRPHQVALLQNRPYSFLLAKSAFTPSLVSGHCLQGALAGCHAFDTWRQAGFNDATSIDLLGQFCCDVGDRRVFAGVHYPSDNLSSWYAALRICAQVFADTEPARFLWRAITTRSRVYAAIAAHAAQYGNSPYRPALQLLAATTASL